MVLDVGLCRYGQGEDLGFLARKARFTLGELLQRLAKLGEPITSVRRRRARVGGVAW